MKKTQIMGSALLASALLLSACGQDSGEPAKKQETVKKEKKKVEGQKTSNKPFTSGETVNMAGIDVTVKDIKTYTTKDVPDDVKTYVASTQMGQSKAPLFIPSNYMTAVVVMKNKNDYPVPVPAIRNAYQENFEEYDGYSANPVEYDEWLLDYGVIGQELQLMEPGEELERTATFVRFQNSNHMGDFDEAKLASYSKLTVVAPDMDDAIMGIHNLSLREPIAEDKLPALETKIKDAYMNVHSKNPYAKAADWRVGE